MSKIIIKIKKETCIHEQLGCNKCKNFNLHPKIYWSKNICSILKYNQEQTKCINFIEIEYYSNYRFSFTLECSNKGSLIARKNLVKYLKENHYAFNNIQSEIIE